MAQNTKINSSPVQRRVSLHSIYSPLSPASNAQSGMPNAHSPLCTLESLILRYNMCYDKVICHFEATHPHIHDKSSFFRHHHQKYVFHYFLGRKKLARNARASMLSKYSYEYWNKDLTFHMYSCVCIKIPWT